MPVFDTPHPIDLAINVQVGAVDVVASDRTDTVVTVAATNPEKDRDRRGADETRIEFDGGRLTVIGPKHLAILGPSESIDVRVELPTDSRLAIEIYGAVNGRGRLGATRIKASTVRLEHTRDLWARAMHGNTVVGTVDGSAEITADHGQIKLGAVSGDAVLKASHGAVEIAESGGDVDARLSYGDLGIARARGSVAAKTAYGSVQIDDVSTGSIELDTGYGQVEVGVREGVAAWLDLASKQGRVRNELAGDRAPEPSQPTVSVRARTAYGDIAIRRVG
ncbi:MAG: DUF4097 family beta strand repeat protein [Micrococcales bacterium]|nr:DUF4097 family beta strand repeat protein [Micrococcales bacterium]